MPTSLKPQREFVSEIEAARALNISITRLHMLLDENVFNDGSQGPQELTFRATDLVLIGFWQRTSAHPKVSRMPRPRSAM